MHYKFDSDHWQYREVTGADVGCDCEFELSEDNYWRGHKIECQVKGTRHLDDYLLKDRRTISFPLAIKTICYGLGKAHAFILLVVDVDNEIVYYLNLQDYFINGPSLFEKLDIGNKTMSIRIPTANRLEANDDELREFARKVYVGGPTASLSLAAS